MLLKTDNQIFVLDTLVRHRKNCIFGYVYECGSCSRLQIQGELSNGVNTEYRGMIRTALGIAREEVSIANDILKLAENGLDLFAIIATQGYLFLYEYEFFFK